MTASKADFRAGVMQRTNPSVAVEAAKDFIHHVRSEDAFRDLVLAAEPGPEGIGNRLGIRVVGQFVFLAEGQGEAVAFQGLREA